LDDYGSGYSNMNYLLTLPFKMVKIDKNIVWSAYGNLRTQTALAATIKMIHELGMTVLAEGVETQEQCEWLSQLGCDYLQGYYFSKPLKKEDFLDMMLKSVEEHSSELESMEE
jgi:EAL domain-containing protein (putative c-di-GMP-specific phosphodiesterase class I)